MLLIGSAAVTVATFACGMLLMYAVKATGTLRVKREHELEGLDVTFHHGAIEDPVAVAAAMDGVDAVVNFAAETHVDRSIAEPDAFARTLRMWLADTPEKVLFGTDAFDEGDSGIGLAFLLDLPEMHPLRCLRISQANSMLFL